MAAADARKDPPQLLHHIYYLAGDDLRTDRHNLALLEKIAQRTTTPIVAEVLYTGSCKPKVNTAIAGEIRLHRINSQSDFALAAHLLKAEKSCLVFFSYKIMAHPHDIWQALGFAERNAVVCLYPQKAFRICRESYWQHAFRSAQFDLLQFVGAPTQLQPAVLALNLSLLENHQSLSRTSFLAQKYLTDILRGLSAIKPTVLYGRSYNADSQALPWLRVLHNTANAWKIWRQARYFPYWFSYKHSLFLVAQAAFYTALLTAPLTMRGAFLLTGFAVLLTLPFFLRGSLACTRSLVYNRRMLPHVLLRFIARISLYAVG